jgi:hypothetical protein
MSLNKLTRRTVGEKVAMAGGAAALAMVSGNMATAGIVASTTAPISPPTSDSFIVWDVDSDGTADFGLINSSTESASLSERNGGRFVAANSRTFAGFQKLASGFVVQSSMAGYQFFYSAQRIIVTSSQGIVTNLAAQGWAMGDVGFFGFKFTSGANTYFGWGEIDIHGANEGYGFTITRAYYNNTPFAPITVGDTGSAIPEPSACALALLAAGGVAAYRGRRKQPAA